jgi:hypothetical protein
MELSGREFPWWKRGLWAVGAMVVAAGVWLPALHWGFVPAVGEYRVEQGISPRARELAARQLALWEDAKLRQGEVGKMRATNGEWDFMGRTYLVLALGEMALRQPGQRERYVAVMDQILDETLRLEKERGMYYFLMDYAKSSPYVAKPARSVFVDGEIALMLGVRQEVMRSDKYAGPLAERVDEVVREMERGPVMCAESYPDECWMFCNTLGAAAVKISDHVDGRDHGAFLATWLTTVKAKLRDEKSGMLVSSFTYRGEALDGPEGSSIWMVAHCLKLIDPDFAQEQYELARKQLGREVLGFGYAREWPPTWAGPEDVDSGPIVPVVGASAGSSGLAVLGAASFGDEGYLRELLTTLDFAAFPMREGGGLRYGASNQVGDAVVLYALVQGPMWARVQEVRR